MKWFEQDERYGRWLALTVVLFLLAMCLPDAAQAQTIASNAARITWVNATQLKDGAPIPATGPESLVRTSIMRGTCDAGATTIVAALQILNVTPDVTMVLFENLPDGTFCYRAQHIQENGGASAWSATRSKVSTQPVVLPQKPKAPSITVG